MSSPADASAEILSEHPNFDGIYAEAFTASNLKPDENDTHNDWMLVDADVPEATVNQDGAAYFESLAKRTRVTYAIPRVISMNGVEYDISGGNAVALKATVRNSTLGPLVQVEPFALVADSTIDRGVAVKSDAVVENDSRVGEGVLVDENAHLHKANVGKHSQLRKRVGIRNSTVGERVIVDEDSQITNNSNVRNGSQIGRVTELDHTYLDEQVVVGNDVTIDGKTTVDIGARIDDHVRIRGGVHIGKRAQILRHAEVKCDVPDHGVAISDDTDHIIVHTDRIINADGMLGTIAARKGKRRNK